MPTPYIEKVAKEHGWTVEETEQLWEAAKTAVIKDDKSKDEKNIPWGVVTNNFKALVKERAERKTKGRK
jgi:hypothetical protein